MKKLLLLPLFLFCFTITGHAQSDTSRSDTTAYYKISYGNGEYVVGQILRSNDREIYVRTDDGRQFYIPQYVVRKVERLYDLQVTPDGHVILDDPFATRYFITTNGIPMTKGTSYVQWSLYGPDFQFSVTDRVGIGIMTTWIGVPLVGNIKFTVINEEKYQFAVGALLGTGSWIAPDFLGVLPFGTFSIGDRISNFSISAGYGKSWPEGNSGGRALMGVGGMTKVSDKVSFVFDSFIILPKKETVTTGFAGYVKEETFRTGAFWLLIPGFRWHKSDDSAFQFGFAGAIYQGEVAPIPFPMIKWFRRL